MGVYDPFVTLARPVSPNVGSPATRNSKVVHGNAPCLPQMLDSQGPRPRPTAQASTRKPPTPSGGQVGFRRGDWDDAGLLESTLAFRMLSKPQHKQGKLGMTPLAESLLSPRDHAKAAELERRDRAEVGSLKGRLASSERMSNPAKWRDYVSTSTRAGQKDGALLTRPGDAHHAHTNGVWQRELHDTISEEAMAVSAAHMPASQLRAGSPWQRTYDALGEFPTFAEPEVTRVGVEVPIPLRKSRYGPAPGWMGSYIY
eukprot:6955937-Prymnesium_polylepis.1